MSLINSLNNFLYLAECNSTKSVHFNTCI